METVVQSDVSHYTYRVAWPAEDSEFIATCAEFPSLSWLASSQIEALKGLENLLCEVLADLAEQGEPGPLSGIDPLPSAGADGQAMTRLFSARGRDVVARDGQVVRQAASRA